MNKTLLLVICDFLLLNLLALTRWEKAEPARPPKAPVPQVLSSAKTTEQDLVDAMRLSLADEQAAKAQLAAELEARDKNLAQLQGEKEQLSSSLQTTEKKATELNTQLSKVTEDAASVQARLAQAQRELDLKKAEADRQREQLAALEKAHKDATDKIEGLSVAVQVAEKEKALLAQTTETLKHQVEEERQERQKVHETQMQLAQGVGQLAEKSGELTKEIRDNRPINANVLFNDFLTNRVSVKVDCERSSFLGAVRRSSTTNTVLVSDGNQVYALLHVWETPLGFQELAYDWDKINIELSNGGRRIQPSKLSFISVDPRILAIPLDATQVAALGCKVYPLSVEAFKFPDAMLVNRGGEGYGEVPFKLDSSQPSYVKMDNRLIRRLSGVFSPSRGDLVFSKSGEVLGLMVSSDFCGLVNAVVLSRSIQLGDTSNQSTAKLLTEMGARLQSLPFRLQ